jgi:lipoprotein-anchoring transpeptidase ErfK/SrfK
VNRRAWLIIAAASVFVAGLIVLVLMVLKNPAKQKAQQISANNASAAILLTQAKELEVKNSLLEARAVYQKMVSEFVGSSEVMNWQKRIEDLNMRILFSPLPTAKSMLYEIKPGDTLYKIAKEYRTTTELIKKSNNLPDDRIVPGRKIKVYTFPFSILVDKSQNILTLKSGEEIVKTYVVSTGKNNCTPVGTLKITNKLLNPAWFKAGAVVPAQSPENVLGTRWLGFDLAGYGIHGTTEPQNLGKQATQGCVRMSNPEVEELYTIVPVGTEVTITD